MAALHSDISTDLGCRRNLSIHANPLISVRIGEIMNILALCWCPGVVVFHLQCALHIFYKQPQRISPIWNVLQYDFCMSAEMSGMDINWGEAPHVLETGLDSWSARTDRALSSDRGCSQVLFLGIWSPHVGFGHFEGARWDAGFCQTWAQRKGCCDARNQKEIWIICNFS